MGDLIDSLVGEWMDARIEVDRKSTLENEKGSHSGRAACIGQSAACNGLR